ncbi:leucine-rich repeat-containing protein 17 [Arapaima gigas]
MVGNEVLMMDWVVFSTLCGTPQPEAVKFPHQIEMQEVRMLSGTTVEAGWLIVVADGAHDCSVSSVLDDDVVAAVFGNAVMACGLLARNSRTQLNRGMFRPNEDGSLTSYWGLAVGLGCNLVNRVMDVGINKAQSVHTSGRTTDVKMFVSLRASMVLALGGMSSSPSPAPPQSPVSSLTVSLVPTSASQRMRATTALLMLLLWGCVTLGWARRHDRHGKARGRVRKGTGKRSISECKEFTDAGERYLDCQDRQLTAVPTGWRGKVDHLLLARNKIQILPHNAFVHFKGLKSLDLQQNLLAGIEANAFAGLSQLTTLLLQHNHLRRLTEEVLLPLPRLTYLRLYDNPWDCQCPLDSLVRTLQVPSKRNLGNYAKCAGPPALQGRRLKKIRPELLCPELEDNILQEPKGPSQDRIPITSHLDVTTACHIYMVPKPVMDCQNRDLKSVPADIPPYAVKVDLSKNNIRHLRNKVFMGSKDLRSLNLSSNGLEHIDTDAFASLLYLRELDLSNNNLHYFQYGVLEDLYFARRLALGGNPWECDYNIHYLVYWLKLHPAVEHSGLVCRLPAEFAGWTVHEYIKTYTEDCPKDKLMDPNVALDGGVQNPNALEPNDQDPNALEVIAKTEEDEKALLPRPFSGAKTYKVIRL